MESKSMDKHGLENVETGNLNSDASIFKTIKEKANFMIPSEYIFGFLKCNVSSKYKPLTLEKLNKICKKFHGETFDDTVMDFQAEGLCLNAGYIYEEFKERPYNCKALIDLTLNKISPKDETVIQKKEKEDYHEVQQLLGEIRDVGLIKNEDSNIKKE